MQKQSSEAARGLSDGVDVLGVITGLSGKDKRNMILCRWVLLSEPLFSYSLLIYIVIQTQTYLVLF